MVNPAGIQMDKLCFRIGDFAIEDLSLTIHPGEYFVLTGPNGSGKTLILRLIAGLYQPAAGDILFNGRSVIKLPPWQRELGYVPQDGVLFPNRSVRRNIAFGLEVRRLPKEHIKGKVQEMADLLKINPLLERLPDGLSGGERQKASLAQALVLGPAVLLLDEPVSAIAEDSRDALCRELRTIQQELQITVLHVAHNQHETKLVADRVGLLKEGRLHDIVDPESLG